MQAGPIPLSRAAPRMQLPGTQPWVPQWGIPVPKDLAPIPGPRIGTRDHEKLGYQFAPGQGADTPGAGGAGVPGGETAPVETLWFWNGYVIPQSKWGPHPPGTVGWIGSRRSAP